MAITYSGELYDSSIINIVTEIHHPGAVFSTLTGANKRTMQDATSDMYLATMFLAQSDKQRYGKVLEELENRYTKVTMITRKNSYELTT
jgi:hypothetical protein